MNPELRSEMEQQNRLETRGGLNAGSLTPAADITLQHIRHFYSRASNTDPQRFKHIIGADVSGMLETRMSQVQVSEIISKFSEQQLVLFKKTIDLSKRMFKEKLNVNGQKGNGESFWQIENYNIPDSNYPISFRGPHNEQVRVQFKEYATFVPTSDEPNDLLSEIIKFYDALLRSYAKIKELAQTLNIDIKMKFADDIKVLLGNIDSVVLYVPNPVIGKQVQDVIKYEMLNRGIQLGSRNGRHASGFDMIINNEEVSHRQLTGRAIAKIMAEDYTGSQTLANYDNKRLVESIIEGSQQAGMLTPEQMLQAI